MNYELKKVVLEASPFTVNAFHFVPKSSIPITSYAIFTHGYTSHKGDIIMWGQRLAERGVSTLIFDLPGHYLGGFSEVDSFDDFKQNAHTLFYAALNYLNINEGEKLIIGGHSLGAFLALKSMHDDHYQLYKTICICVGLGLHELSSNFVERNNFFVEIIKERTLLISKELAPDKIMPWFNRRINELILKNQKIFIINGEDDFVAGQTQSIALYNHLNKDNETKSITPKSLPHHGPERAAIHIRKLLQEIDYIL